MAQTLLAPRYELTFSEPKTKHGKRSIDLDSETVAVLRAHRRRQAEERLAFGPGYDDRHDLVFRREDGKPIVPHLFSLAFQTAVRDAGLPPMRLHDLRHTHVALLAKAGVPAKVIQERLGHHSAAFTLDAYGGTFPSMHREAAERVAQLLAGSGSAATGDADGRRQTGDGLRAVCACGGFWEAGGRLASPGCGFAIPCKSHAPSQGRHGPSIRRHASTCRKPFSQATKRHSRASGGTRQRSSLFASWSNHIANSVNCVPETSRSATRTMVGVVMSFPQPIRRIVTSRPSRKPTRVISAPSV